MVQEDTAPYLLGSEENEGKKINNEDDKVCRKMLDIKEEERLNIIKEMLKRNMPIDLISEITHSSKQVIRKIAKS